LLRATHRVHEPEAWVEQLIVAAKSQTVVVAGAETAAELVAELAEQLNRVLDRRQRLEKEIERAFFNLPEASILKSLPGIGPRLGARILIEIGDIRQFRTSAQLAAYAGLGPTPHQSGTSIRGNRPTRFGNHHLKNAFYLAALSSLQHPPSRVYYDASESRASVTRKPCSASLGGVSTFCTPCLLRTHATSRRPPSPTSNRQREYNIDSL